MKDASHLYTPTPDVRRVGNSKGPDHAATVGRIIAPNIHIKPIKTKAAPAKPPPAQEPESSKSAVQKGATSTDAAKSTVRPEEKKPAVPKKTGKLDFFGAAKKEQDKAVKKEEPKSVAEGKKPAKMFFGAGTAQKGKDKEPKPVVVKKEEVEEDAPPTATLSVSLTFYLCRPKVKC